MRHPHFRDKPQIIEARKQARQLHDRSISTPHHKVLVCLSFGFWVHLLKLQRSTLCDASRKGTNFDVIISGLNDLVKLRNMMAHHEPILDGTRGEKSLKADLATLHNIIDSISPTTAHWLDEHSWIRPLVTKGFTSCKDLQSGKVEIKVW
jgi:hypothetical protein